MKKSAGFSLLEIMIVLALIGVMAALTQGSVVEIIKGQRVKSAASDLFSTLVLARAEALKRNSCVQVVPTSSSNWSLGWRVQVPMSGAAPACGGVDAPTIMRIVEAQEQVVIAGPTASITFTGAGRLSSLGDTSTAGLCINTCSASCTATAMPPGFRLSHPDSSTLRCVVVRSSGAPEVKHS